MTKDEKKKFHAERCNNITLAVTKAVEALENVKKAIGNITPEDEYMFLECRYMVEKYRSMLDGFLHARLANEEYQGRIEFEDD